MSEPRPPTPGELPKQVRDDAEERRRIFQQFFKVNPALTFSPVFASPALDAEEQTKMAEWTAVCDAQAAAIKPLQARIDSTMDPDVLVSLWNQNEAFLRTLATFESAAADLNAKGRPKLSQSLDSWRLDTQATSKMIQFIWNSRRFFAQAAAPAKAPVPVAPSLNRQMLFGIWDFTFSDGRRAEMALDDVSFSYWLLDNSYAFWGTWSVEPNPRGCAFLCLKRGGGYPVKFYGPLGSSDLTYLDNEVWNITAFEANKISFADVPMSRRAPIALPLVTARIAEVQSGFRMADMRDRNNAVAFIAHHNAVTSVQNSMWDYINSGVGRVH